MYLQKPYIQSDISSILNTYISPSHPYLWDICKTDIKSFYCSISSFFSKKTKSSITNLSNRICKLQNSPNPNSSLISHLQTSLSKLEQKAFISLTLRSRIKWYEKGETSSSYFYKRFHTTQTSMNINSLYIPSPIPNSPSTLSNNTQDMLSHSKNHFSSLWSSPPPLPPSSPLTTYIPTLSQASVTSLDTPISSEELFSVIKQKDDHSAPGPDGLTYKFYKSFPTLISKILIPIFHMISTNLYPPPPSWSQTITTLIHKKNTDPRYVNNLHPITLSNTDIKLLSSILATRFQVYASDLIHPHQTGFMKSRSIYNTVLDINSFLTLDNPPPESFVLSIDWSKAYDRVSHSWLDHVLLSSHFPISFINLTHTSYHNRFTRIKLNNSLSSPFPVLQGVPQGDPFAPLLFNLTIEPLFNLIRSVPTLTIRAYADDTTIIGHSLQDYHLLTSSIFPLYNFTTGGIVNLQKSSLYPLSPSTFTPPPNSPPITNSLNILGFSLPINQNNSNSLWPSLLQKVQSRISSVSSRHLSLKGRILVSKTLILSKIWYYASIFPPPSHYITALQRSINNYIWSSSKVHPRFEFATLPLHKGGLNFPDIQKECQIRHAKLISCTFDLNLDPPFWIKSLNQYTISHFHQSLPSCIINQ